MKTKFNNPFGIRTRSTIALSIAIGVILIGAALLPPLFLKTTEQFVAKHDQIVQFDKSDVRISHSELMREPCPPTMIEDCVKQLRSKSLNEWPLQAKDQMNFSKLNTGGDESFEYHMLVRFEFKVPESMIKKLGDRDLVMRLPRMKFKYAYLFRDKEMISEFFDSRRIIVGVERAANEPIVIDVLMRLNSRHLSDMVNWIVPGFMATHSAYTEYDNYMYLWQAKVYRQIAVAARISLGLFLLLIFLLVESSPESLGCALFVAFEACAAIFNMREYRLWLLPAGLDYAGFSEFFYFMGDVFRIYFVILMIRMSETKHFLRWLVLGLIGATIYGSMVYQYNYYVIAGRQWYDWAGSIRNVGIGLFGLSFCLGGAFRLWRAGNAQRRVWALVFAGLSFVAQGYGSLDAFYPPIRDFTLFLGNYTLAYYFLDTTATYLFATSVVLNISTLEGRVKALLRERLKDAEIKKQLELGQTVQRSFLTLPETPDDIELACHYQAATYVSGDSYFADWNAQQGVLTFFLSDVTGHGVQAALKSFAGQILAKSIWQSSSDDKKAKLQFYNNQTKRFFTESEEEKDFTALIGAEFDRNAGLIRFYRVNYSQPIMVSLAMNGHENGNTRVTQLNLPNEEITELKMNPGDVILLASDGVINGSRETFKLVKFLRSHLNKDIEDMDAYTLRDLVLDWMKMNAQPIDDQTIVIFHWREAEALALRKVVS